MLSTTKMVVFIIVAVVVSASIVAFSLNKDKVMTWFNPNLPVDSNSDRVTETFSMRNIIESI